MKNLTHLISQNFKKNFFLFFLLIISSSDIVFSQCNGNFDLADFPANLGVKIIACYNKKDANGLVTGSWNSVDWRITNLTSDKLEVHFTKVYYFKNGKVIRKSVDIAGYGIDLKPGGKDQGGTFSGDLLLNDNFFKEDCDCPGDNKHILKLSYEDLKIDNISQKERVAAKADADAVAAKKKQDDEVALKKFNEDQQAKAEASRKQQEAYHKQQEDKKQEAINQQNAASQKKYETISDGVNNIGNTLTDAIGQRSAQNDERERRKAENENNKANSEQGHFESCTKCVGTGRKDCHYCNGQGSEQCSGCFGTGKSNCISCWGSGTTSTGKSCTACSGTGKTKCMYCSGKGSKGCVFCHSKGYDQCTYCSGTGKKFVKAANYSSNNSGSNSSASTPDNNNPNNSSTANSNNYSQNNSSAIVSNNNVENGYQAKTYEGNFSKSWIVGVSLGVNYANIPLIKNMTVDKGTNYSKTSKVCGQGFCFGVEIWPFRGPHLGIGGFGDLQYGFLSFETWGCSSKILIYNYGGTLLLGAKRIKGIFEYSIHSRNVSFDDHLYSKAYDTATTVSGKATYLTSRIGGGIMYEFGDNEDENNFRIMLLFDRPDFLPLTNPPVMVGRIQYKTNEWNLKFEYANNYAIAGQKQFTWIGKSNQDYFLISVAFVMTWEGEYKKKSN